jgi:tripartite-type tricarboxylate transporter receptor subunit TctC
MSATIRASRMAAGLLLGSATVAQTVRADPVEDFYKDATVNLYIGFPAGGGYDIYGRLAARYLGRHIPGNPKIVPQNMVGAGGIRAANYLYGAAPKDGTALGIIPDTAPSEELLGTQGVAYVSKNFNWIGRITSSVNVQAFWHTSKIASIADLMQREGVVGGSGPAAPRSPTRRCSMRWSAPNSRS